MRNSFSVPTNVSKAFVHIGNANLLFKLKANDREIR